MQAAGWALLFPTPGTLHFHTDPGNWLLLLSPGNLLSPLALLHGHLEGLLRRLKKNQTPQLSPLHLSAQHRQHRWGLPKPHVKSWKRKNLERTVTVTPHLGKTTQSLWGLLGDDCFRFWVMGSGCFRLVIAMLKINGKSRIQKNQFTWIFVRNQAESAWGGWKTAHEFIPGCL